MFLLGYGNLIAQATIGGVGSWQAGAPASNVKTWALAETARSTDATAASTKLRIDWGTAQAARVLILMGDNISAAGTVRWMRGSSAGGTEVADSGAVDRWHFTPRAADGQVYDAQVVLGAQSSARYEQIEIVDTGNADGYIEIGRIFIGPAVAPAYGPNYGLIDSHDDLSVIGRAHSGAEWPAPNRRLRRAQFELTALTLDEGDQLHEIEQIEGLTGEVAYLPMPDRQAHMQRYGMVGLMQELNGIQFPRHGTRARAFNVRQRA